MTEDNDPIETREWLDALDALLRHGGSERAAFVMAEMAKHAVEDRYAITNSYYLALSQYNFTFR